MRASVKALILTIIIIGSILVGMGIQGAQTIICDGAPIALHETENIYPAWQYNCRGNQSVIILD